MKQSYCITNERAKGRGKDLLGILLSREPDPGQVALSESAPTFRGINPLPNGGLGVRVPLRGRCLVFASVTPEMMDHKAGRYWALVLADLASFHFLPWRQRGHDRLYNFSAEHAKAILEENDGENDILLNFQLMEDSLVNAGDIPSRTIMESAKADASAHSGSRHTAAALLASIEAQRARDVDFLHKGQLTHGQKAERHYAETADLIRALQTVETRLASVQTQVNRLEGIAQAVLVTVRALQAPAPVFVPAVAPVAPAGAGEVGWPLPAGPMCLAGEGVVTGRVGDNAGPGWRTGLEND